MNCPECSSQVSSIAVSCPHCGAPISSGGQAIGAPLTTVQETSKLFKKHIVISSIIFWFGFLMLAIYKGKDLSLIGVFGLKVVMEEMVLRVL